MLRRASLVLLALLVSASGCTMSTGARRATILTGAAMTVAGVLLVHSSATDLEHNGYNDTYLDDNIFAAGGGTLLVAIGAGVLLGGLVAQEEPEGEIVSRVPPVANQVSIAPPAF